MTVLFLAISFTVHANVLTASELTSQITVKGGLEFLSQNQASKIDSVRAELFLFPRTSSSQVVNYLTTEPQAEAGKNSIQYSWNKPEKIITYALSSVVNTREATRVRVKEKYPIQQIPEDIMQFLQPSKIITSSDSRIREQANTIAAGSDDLFVVVTQLADWTKKNIAYNLSSLTAEVAQPASWVIEHKEGVCDELTSLFIAMLRAIGIPGRFVSGISYSNSPSVPNSWGSHGWAEVWFPNTGWVGFDPTFGQYGWVYAGDIKLKESIDPSEKSVQFVWQARDMQVQTKPLTMTGSVLQEGNKRPGEIAITIEPLHDSIGFGSADIIRAKIKNLQNHYVATQIRLASAPEISIESAEQLVILEPQSETILSWLVRVSEGLKEGFSYSMPLLAISDLNETASAVLTVTENLPVYTVEDMKAELSVEQPRKALSCTLSPEEIMPTQTAEIKCKLPTGYTELCLKKECKTGTEVVFSIKYEKPGFFPQHVSTPDKQYGMTAVLHMQDTPVIELQNINSPKIISFEEEAIISWSIEKKSIAEPVNVIIAVISNGKNVSWKLDTFEAQVFTVNLPGRGLGAENEIVIRATWNDIAGKEYATEQKVYLSVQGTWWQKILLWMNGMLARVLD